MGWVVENQLAELVLARGELRMTLLSAREYLEYLKAINAASANIPARFYPEDVDKVVEGLSASGNWTREESQKLQENRREFSDDSDWVETTSRWLLRSCPEQMRQRLSSIPVGTLPISDINAMVCSPSGEPFIVVTTGFVGMIFETAKRWVATGRLTGASPELPFHEGAAGVFGWVASWLTHSPDLLPARFDLKSPFGRNMVGAISAHAGSFALGHEYGHVLLGHLPHSTRRDPLAGNPELIERSHEQEHLADEEGFRIVIQNCEALHEGNILPAVAGIELTLRVMALIEKLASDSARLSTHPSAADRLVHFREWLGAERYAAVAKGVETMERFFQLTELGAFEVMKRFPERFANLRRSRP